MSPLETISLGARDSSRVDHPHLSAERRKAICHRSGIAALPGGADEEHTQRSLNQDVSSRNSGRPTLPAGWYWAGGGPPEQYLSPRRGQRENSRLRSARPAVSQS